MNGKTIGSRRTVGRALAIVAGLVLTSVPLWFPLPQTELLETPESAGISYADRVAMSALIATILIAIFSVIPNLRSIERSSRYTHYSELDHMYFEILKLALSKPFYRKPDEVTEAQRPEYNVYAFMVWNFIEAIQDRCEDEAGLRDTWQPVIFAEAKLHRAWFERECVPYQTKAPTFCLVFCDFAWRILDFPLSEPLPAKLDRWKYRSEPSIRGCQAVHDHVFGKPAC